ncbi:MAG: GEVED domain-containing protein [Lysobacterales bacterium]|jgi:hypothetical protein
MKLTKAILITLTLLAGLSPDQVNAQGRDYGDAPEGVLAYPSTGQVGAFPTCVQAGPARYVEHNNFGAWFGPSMDFEGEGNAGTCPVFAPYDNDECFNDGDAGLLLPGAFTITGGVVTPCAGQARPIDGACRTAQWGMDIDIDIHNWMPNHEPYLPAYVNVLVDWNQDGAWAGSSPCGAGSVPEHVLVDFMVPPQYDGPLSALGPPGFNTGPNPGHVWVRFSITEAPVGPGWDGDGIFEDGESEDYLLLIDTPQHQSIPTLGIWGLVALALVLAATAWVAVIRTGQPVPREDARN